MVEKEKRDIHSYMTVQHVAIQKLEVLKLYYPF